MSSRTSQHYFIMHYLILHKEVLVQCDSRCLACCFRWLRSGSRALSAILMRQPLTGPPAPKYSVLTARNVTERREKAGLGLIWPLASSSTEALTPICIAISPKASRERRCQALSLMALRRGRSSHTCVRSARPPAPPRRREMPSAAERCFEKRDVPIAIWCGEKADLWGRIFPSSVRDVRPSIYGKRSSIQIPRYQFSTGSRRSHLTMATHTRGS